MSIQWTIIATYLYFEVVVATIMISPIFSPRRWYQFFNSRLFSTIKHYAAFYFYSVLCVLCLFVIDAIREIRKYAAAHNAGYVNYASELKDNVKLFRAQRNFYITGFAIFLAFVIRRLGRMLIKQHELTLKAAEIKKKAEDTVKLAKTTILTNTMQAAENEQEQEDIKGELEITKGVLAATKQIAKKCEEEASKWKLKYEELAEKISGKGDE